MVPRLAAVSHSGLGNWAKHQPLEERLWWQETAEASKPMPGAAPFWPLPGRSLDADGHGDGREEYLVGFSSCNH